MPEQRSPTSQKRRDPHARAGALASMGGGTAKGQPAAEQALARPRVGEREQLRDPREHPGTLMIILRYVLPTIVTLAGAIVMALGSESDLEGGAGIVGAGLAIFATNWLYRASVEGDRAREQEEAAREYLDLHGHWPNE